MNIECSWQSYKLKKTIWDYDCFRGNSPIASRATLYQKHRSPTRRKRKGTETFLQDTTIKEWQGVHIFESITGCEHPIIASGATTIRSASRAPDKINTRPMKLGWQYTWAYTRKTFDYSLGGYYHREHYRAPDDNRKHRLHCRQD
jgi:hypothetical protein